VKWWGGTHFWTGQRSFFVENNIKMSFPHHQI
jgi:hypothetical protein